MASEQVYEYGSIPLVVTDQGDSYQLDAADVAAMEVAGVTETFSKERIDIMRERARAFGYALTQAEPVPVEEPAPAAPKTQKKNANAATNKDIAQKLAQVLDEMGQETE